MENVQFNEESIARSAPVAARKPKGMAGFLIKNGWVKDEKGAQYILLGIAAVALITSLFFWWGILSEPEPDAAAPVDTFGLPQ